ncbi:MAG: NYN domain-containing protein [Candidatus Lokiarchaeota archaeon]|nr:NYN domain-containing protein [Candidatus Lokiarchaeota archaeon]MBD3337896.1 NYN domain-containing protein [Candidatus Lokiarchaeota archaeon]
MNGQEKVVVFIDGQNMLFGARDTGVELVYNKIKTFFDRQFNVIGRRFYSAYEEGNAGQMRFFKVILDLGYELKIKPLRVYIDMVEQRREEKKIDVWLTTDLIKLAHEDRYDRALVFSGDTDFIPAYEYLLTFNKKIGIWTWNKRCSRELVNFSKDNENIDLRLFDDISNFISN